MNVTEQSCFKFDRVSISRIVPLVLRDAIENSKMKNFACKQCARRFFLADTLYSHYRQHMIKEYACSGCFDEFSTKTRFDAHRDSDKSTCKAAKLICKTSINQRKKSTESTRKLLSLVHEFRIEFQNRDEMVRVCVAFDVCLLCVKKM